MFGDLAVAELQYPVGEVEQRGVVRGDESRDVLAADDRAERFRDGVPGLGVELAGRLVGDEEGGAVGEGPGDGDPLLPAAGEFTGPLCGVVGEADEGQQQFDALLALARVARRSRSRSGTPTFSAAVRIGKKPEDWKTKPTRSRRRASSPLSSSPARSLPSTWTRPRSGVSRPPTMFSRVVLPDPERPFRATGSPRGTSKETPRSAWTAAAPVPYDLCTSSTRTMVSVTT